MNQQNMNHNSNYLRIKEDHSITRIFDVLRNQGVDITWVKEQIHGTSCIPETCPRTRSLESIIYDHLEEGEIREGSKPPSFLE
jgi:hypothetical protein